MKYLLIAFVIAMILSPVFWLRQSPGQARITAFRNRALQLGLKVQIVPAADAAESERSLDAVRYLRPFMPDPAGHMPVVPTPWTLLRDGRRGWESPWRCWRWFRAEAPPGLHSAMGECLASLPESVTALRLDSQGLSAYWPETGSIDHVNQIAMGLETIFSLLRGPRLLQADPQADIQADPPGAGSQGQGQG